MVGAREGYADLILHVPLPATALAPGEVRSMHVRAAVCDCWLPRPPRGTPLLYLRLRTPGGDRYVGVVPNRAQFDRLDAIVRRACAS